MTITGIDFSKGSIISQRGIDANEFGIAMATVLTARHFVDLALDIATNVKKIRKNRVVRGHGRPALKSRKIAGLALKKGDLLVNFSIFPALNTVRKPCDNEVNSNQMLSL